MKLSDSVGFRLGLANAATGLTGGIYTPFFGAWLAWRGMAPAEIGALLSLGMLFRVIASPISGVVADARNDRRASMLFLYAITLVGFGALNIVSAPVLIFLFAIGANVAGGAITPLLESVTIRLSERFRFDYGHVRVWGSVVFVACNVASGFAVTQFGLGVVAPWLTVAIVLNIASIWILPAPPKDRPKGDFSHQLRHTLVEARLLLRSRIFLMFLLAASLDQGSHAVYYSFGAQNWIRLGYSGWFIGAIWPLGVLVEITLFALAAYVFRTVGATRLLMLGALGCAIRWTILAFDPSTTVVVLSQILHGATFALAHLGAMLFILRAVPPRLSATAQSLYAVGSNGIAMGAATLAAGPIYAAYHGKVYLLMTAMGVAAGLFAWILHRTWHGGRLTAHGEEEDHGFI